MYRWKYKDVKPKNKRLAALTIDSIVPFMGKVKRSRDKAVGQCPVCGKAGHLYAAQDGEKLLLFCHKCNAPFREIVKAFRDMGAK